MKPSWELDVRVNGVRTGRLTRDREGRTWFIPEAAWVAGGQIPPLGIGFMRRPDPRMAGTGLPTWFENLLPARGGALRARICAERGLRDTDSAGLLLALGRDLPGAVEVTGDHAEAEAISAEPDLRISFSLGGMQLKFSMAEVGGRFALPARDQEGAFIVKLPGDRFHELPEVEQATMLWGAAVGVPTPPSRVVSTEQIVGLAPSLRAATPRAFVIRRFDRLPGFRRVHQEDFAQALEIDPEHLYGDTGPKRTSYDLLLAFVGDAAGDVGRDAFIDRVAFVIASGNGDAHLKNWSFLWSDPQRPVLSPSYDQVATVSWPDFGWDASAPPTLGLSFGRSKQLVDLDLARLRTFATRGRAPDGEARFLAALERARAEAMPLLHLFPQRMRDALATHWGRVPILRHIGGFPA